MSSGSEFGRRPNRSQVTQSRRQPSRDTEVGTENRPVEETGDPLQKALTYAGWAAGALVVVVAGLWIMLPTPKAVAPVADQRPAAPAVRTAKKVAAPTGMVDADSVAANEPVSSEPAADPDAGKAPEKGERTADAKPARSEAQEAALKFFGFYHLNTRVRSAYCSRLGVDMEPFAAGFRNSQRQAHARALAIIKADGRTEEQVFAGSRAELEGLIGDDIAKIGRQIGKDEAGACKTMVQFADKIVPGIDFAKVMPDAHRALMGS